MLLAVRNIVKAWLLVLALAGAFALFGWVIGGVRGLSIFVFCALLVAAGAYWTFDRVVLGMVRARELLVAEAPLLHSTVERLASRAGVMNVAKTFSLATNSRKSAYQVPAWYSAVSLASPPASSQSIVARRTRRVSASKWSGS